jgi:hypothetical protein
MAVVTIMCSRTGDFISVGLVTDEAGFKALRPVVFRMCCPSCGSEHTWSKGRAWLSEATDRRVVHGGRVIEVGSPKTPIAAASVISLMVPPVARPVSDSTAVSMAPRIEKAPSASRASITKALLSFPS